jgi:hypothetical protein
MSPHPAVVSQSRSAVSPDDVPIAATSEVCHVEAVADVAIEGSCPKAEPATLLGGPCRSGRFANETFVDSRTPAAQLEVPLDKLEAEPAVPLIAVNEDIVPASGHQSQRSSTYRHSRAPNASPRGSGNAPLETVIQHCMTRNTTPEASLGASPLLLPSAATFRCISPRATDTALPASIRQSPRYDEHGERSASPARGRMPPVSYQLTMGPALTEPRDDHAKREEGANAVHGRASYTPRPFLLRHLSIRLSDHQPATT